MSTTAEFLRHYGNPVVISLSDVKGVDNFNKAIHHHPDVLFKVNAAKDTPYGLFFTPNGNYGSLQKEGQPISRSQTSPGDGPHYNCLVVDVDLKDCILAKTMEECFINIEETLKRISIGPTHIIQSGGGYHLYWKIKESDRKSVHNLYGEKVFAISRYLRTLFDGGCMGCGATKGQLSAVMRLPGSFHRKTEEMVPVKIIYENLADELDLACIEKSLKQIGEEVKMTSVGKDIAASVGATRYVEANGVPMQEIIEKLKDYPRTYNGHKQIFTITNGTHICITDENGNTTRTDSYRVWREKNCVHCFTPEAHPIEERPRGEVFPFLHHYFHKNNLQVKTFLTKEFGIQFHEAKKENTEQTLQTFAGQDYFVECTDRRVIMHKQVQRGKASIELHTDMFKKPVKIIGKSWTKFHANGTECEDEQMVYVMELDIGGEIKTKLLYRFPTKKRFNEKYSGALFFYGEDNDLGMWYEAMDGSDLPVVQVTVLSGMYRNEDNTTTVILGGKVIYGEPGLRYYTPAFECKTKLSQEISLVEFYKKFIQIYEPEIAIPAFLQYIAMCGMNIWEGTTVYPSMLVTGKTGCGKSSIAEILKNMAGYTATDRKVALPQITPQPLKVAATDNAILYPDELTLQVNEKSEEGCRNIVNRDKGARGVGAENAYYNFRSPLFFTGERTFKDESLNNRIVILVLSDKYWKKDAKDKVIEIKNYSCINDIYNGYSEYKRDINELQAQKVSMLVKQGVNPRNADVRAYIFTVNEVFDFGFEEEELIRLTKLHLSKMGFGDQEAMSDEGELQMYLSKMLFTKQALCTEERYTDMRVYRFIFMDDTMYQKARGVLTGVVNSINARGQRITVSKHGIVIRQREVQCEIVDFVLEKVMSYVLSCNRFSVQYVDRENEAGPTE